MLAGVFEGIEEACALTALIGQRSGEVGAHRLA
jgi:hypothetical protein